MAVGLSQPCYFVSFQMQQQKRRAGSDGGLAVHVASMPLRGRPQWALLSADRLLSIQHFYTIIQPILPAGAPCTVFDFQPLFPEEFVTVITGLSGGRIPGVVLERTIEQLPARRCWKVGIAKDFMGMKEIAEFNREWDTTLRLGTHDCRHYTDAFVEFLTGQKEILDKLKKISKS